MGPHDEYTHRILTAIEEGRPISQRSLARELGVALGLTNLLIRRLVKKGYVKVTTMPRNRMRYLITPSGLAEKARVSRDYFANTVRLYTETRDRIRSRFVELSDGWPDADRGAHGEKRIVFYGAGEVAEIAYVSLQGSDLSLVGVTDDFVRRRFFGLEVQPPDRLRPDALAGEPFNRLVVASIRKSDIIQQRLDAMGFPQDRVFTL